MEIKVSVEGVQRIVCGVTEMTSCQEVVIALARALGRTGRYTLRENFKGYERSMTPGEHLLESLEKYGQQAREVQFTLYYLGPSLVEWPNKPQVRLRRVEGKGNLYRSSADAVLHRQSLPPLDHLQPKTPEESKRLKRNSLTLIGEAWGWLENLGKGRKQQLPRDKSKNGSQRRDTLETKPDKSVQVSWGSQGIDKNRLGNKNVHKEKTNEICESIPHPMTQRNELRLTENQASVSEHDGDSEKLKNLIIQQQSDLRVLKLKIDTTDKEILNYEKQSTESMSDDDEQLEFWLNELKAEDGYEKDLQMQFWDLKGKAAECKRQLEQYKLNLERMNLATMRHTRHQTKPGAATSVRLNTDRSYAGLESVPEETTATDIPEGDSMEKMAISRVQSNLPYIMVTANEITESQSSSPSELREWWHWWTNAQKTTEGKVAHRSEITIHLRGTAV